MAQQIEARSRGVGRSLQHDVVLAHELLERVVLRQCTACTAHAVQAGLAVDSRVESAAVCRAQRAVDD
eukprot:5537850-Prymnesium_polylepis.2